MYAYQYACCNYRRRQELTAAKHAPLHSIKMFRWKGSYIAQVCILVQKQFYKKFYKIKVDLTYRNIRQPPSQILVFLYFISIWLNINVFSVAGKWKYFNSNPTKNRPNPTQFATDIHSVSQSVSQTVLAFNISCTQ